jgi:hypothetical protein
MRFFACLLLATACTSSADTADDDTGQSPGGGSLDAADEISATVTVSDEGGDSSHALIVLASTSNLCDDAGSVDRKGQHFISIELRDVNGSTRTAPTAAGTYTIYPNTGSEPAKSASLTVGAFDDTCQLDDNLAASGQSGTVTLTSVTGGVYRGSYDFTLNSGSHITGTFAPTACPKLATATDSGHSCL